jgi:hypothetical protein
MDSSTKRQQIYADIEKERNRQDAKWGGPEHDRGHLLEEWLDFIEKQISNLDVALETGGPVQEEYRRRMINIAALAVAAIEVVDVED